MMEMPTEVLMKMYKDGRPKDKSKLITNLLQNVEKSLENLSSNGMSSSILFESKVHSRDI
jgi:hypothetical protein